MCVCTSTSSGLLPFDKLFIARKSCNSSKEDRTTSAERLARPAELNTSAEFFRCSCCTPVQIRPIGDDSVPLVFDELLTAPGFESSCQAGSYPRSERRLERERVGRTSIDEPDRSSQRRQRGKLRRGSNGPELACKVSMSIVVSLFERRT